MNPRKQFAIYMTASRMNGTIYIGMTSDLPKRIWQHREKVGKGFTAAHNVTRLVWFESHETAEVAITREKQLKKWRRAWKVKLIEENNPLWRDLYDEIAGG